MYNAEGQHFIPLIAHRGHVVNAVENYFEKHMMFFRTNDGLFNRTSLVDVVKLIDRYNKKIRNKLDS